MRWFLLALLSVLLAACGAQPPAPPPASLVPTDVPTPPRTVAIPALLREPQRWSGSELTLITALDRPDDRVLDFAGESQNGEQQGIWLAEPLPITATAVITGTAYVELHGNLSPPGAYGRDARFLYQFSADRATVLQPERTTLANLAANPHAFDDVLVAFDGILLTGDEGTLMVDEVMEGGVPTTRAKQIKLREFLDTQVPSNLQHSGSVRFGPVHVVGWWDNGSLLPFEVQPAEHS